MKKLKVNFQKILAFIAALSIILSVSAFSVFADDEHNNLTDVKNYLQEWLNNGTQSAWNAYKNAVSECIDVAYSSPFRSVVTFVENFHDYYVQSGLESELAYSIAHDYITGQLGDYMHQQSNGYDVPEPHNPVNGYGAGISLTSLHGSDYGKTIVGYCDYITLQYDNGLCYYHLCGNIYSYDEYKNGSYYRQRATGLRSFQSNEITDLQLWGDIRLLNHSMPEDEFNDYLNSVRPNEIFAPVYNFDGLTDEQLEQLLYDLVKNLTLDLYSNDKVENLLQKLLYKLDKLDKLDNIDSDNDNELLSDILDEIRNNGAALAEINHYLGNLDLTDPDFGGNVDVDEFKEAVLFYLYPDTEYVTEYQIFATKVKGLFNTKFSFIDEFKNFFSSISWNEVDDIELPVTFNGNTYIMSTSVFSSVMPVFRGMLAFFIYGLFAVRTFKKLPSVIYNGGDN